jgi:photosystem II stability/assembly factor-like uncharacterized protein
MSATSAPARWFWVVSTLLLAACGAGDDATSGGDTKTPTGSGAGDPGGGGGSGASNPTGSGGFVPPACADRDHALPSDAPTFAPGVWTNISPAGVPFDASATSLTQGMTIDPCNPATIYVCIRGEQSGLYRSTNAGSTWQLVSPESMCINVRVDPADPNHLYAGNGVGSGADGFWVSRDGGQTWEMPQGFLDAAGAPGVNVFDVYHVEPNPADFNHVLVSFHYYWQNPAWGDLSLAGVLETFDGGDSWIAHQPDPGWHAAGGYDVFFLHDPELGIGDERTWLYGTQGAGYWRTTDAGETWTKVSDVDMQHGGGQLYYTKDGVLYLSGAPSLLRSEDNGETWDEIGPPGAYLSVTGDGKALYTAQHGGGSFITARENDDTNWTTYPDDRTFFEGPFQMSFDPYNRILYAANIRAGVWALRVLD